MLSRRANDRFDIREGECPSCGSQGIVIGISISEDVYKCNQCDLCFLKKSVRPKADNDNHWYEDLRDCSQSLLEKFIKDMGEQYSAQVRILERLVAGRT